MSKKSHHSKYLTYGLFAGAVSTLGLLSASQTVNAQQLTVKTGDTIWGLAKQHGLSISALEQANPSVKRVSDSVDLIFAGQQLTLPSTTANQALNADGSYTVQPGDTLGTIAEQYQVSVQQLMAWNNLSAEDSIYIGQHLIIDGTGATAVSQPAVTTATQNVNSQVSVASEQPQAASQTTMTTTEQQEQATISTQSAVSAQPAPASVATASSVAPSSVAATTITTSSAAVSGAVTSASSVASQSAATVTTQSFATSQTNVDPNLARYVAQSFVQVPVGQTNQATANSTSQAATQTTTQPVASQVTQQSTAAQSQASVTVADQAQPTSSVAQSAQSATPAQQSRASASQDLQQGSVVSLATKIANSNSVPYVWGGSSLSGMDCSGLVDYVYANAEGKQLPHNTVALESYVNQHAVSEAQPGDLLFWGNHGSTYHTAIYTGNNQYVAAAKPGTNVATYTISPYFQPSFAGTVK